MQSWPQPFWAILIAMMGFSLAIVVLMNQSSDGIKTAVLAVASSLVSGALGAFAGAAHSQANSSTTATGPNTTINQPTPVAPQVNGVPIQVPIQAVEPPQPKQGA